jgi:hypothetical protein
MTTSRSENTVGVVESADDGRNGPLIDGDRPPGRRRGGGRPEPRERMRETLAALTVGDTPIATAEARRVGFVTSAQTGLIARFFDGARK